MFYDVIFAYHNNMTDKYDAFIDNANDDRIFTAKVIKAVESGLVVRIDEVIAFVPKSHIGDDDCGDLLSYVGCDFDVKVIGIKHSERPRPTIIASHKILLDEENRDKFVNNLTVGSKVHGRVKSITSYGVFVTIYPSIKGLILLSDLSWNHVKRPSDIVSIGQEIEAVVLEIKECDNLNQKFRLGLKQLGITPWDKFDKDTREGDIIEWPVSYVTRYGLFLRSPSGVEGFVHWRELSCRRTSSRKYAVGEIVCAKVVVIEWGVTLLLSIKQAEDELWINGEHLFQLGAKVHGTISNVKSQGLFCILSNGIEGIIPYCELIWIGKIKRVKDLFHVGEEIDSVILGKDKETHYIILSKKRLFPDPARVLTEGQSITACIIDIIPSGIMVHLDGINQNGFIPNSRITLGFNAKIGDCITCKVDEVNSDSYTLISVYVSESVEKVFISSDYLHMGKASLTNSSLTSV